MDNTPYIDININKLNESFSIGELWDDMFTNLDEIRCVQGLYNSEIARLIGPTLRLKFISIDPSLEALASPDDLRSIIKYGNKSIIGRIRRHAAKIYKPDRVNAIEAWLLSLSNVHSKKSIWKECILMNALVINNSKVDIKHPRHSIVIYRITKPDLELMFKEHRDETTSSDHFMASGIFAHDLIPKRRIGEKQEYDQGYMNPNDTYQRNILNSHNLMKHPAVFSEAKTQLDTESITFILNQGLIDLESFVSFANNYAIFNVKGIYYYMDEVNRSSRENTSLFLNENENDLNQHLEAIEDKASDISPDDIDSSGDLSNSIQGLEL